MTPRSINCSANVHCVPAPALSTEWFNKKSSGSAASAYVESSVVMFPDNTNACDPGETAP